MQRLEQTLTANAMSHLASLANHINDITAPAYFSLLNSASPSGGSSVTVASHGVLIIGFDSTDVLRVFVNKFPMKALLRYDDLLAAPKLHDILSDIKMFQSGLYCNVV
jgi:hypothetical protein